MHEGFFTTRPARRERWQAILLACVCSLAFLREAVLPTQALLPFVPEHYEPLQSEARAAGRLVEADLERGNVTMGDKYNQSLAWDRVLQDRLRDGEIPLWCRELAGGSPFVPQMAQVYQPWNLLLAALPVPSAGIYGIWFFLHQALFGVFAWHFLRRLGVAQAAACFGLVVAELGLWTQARIHHNVIVTAALPLFPLLTLIGGAFAADRARSLRATLARAGLVAVCLGLSWSSGFAPVSLQATWIAGAFAILCACRSRDARPLLGLGTGVVLGVVISLAQMVPVLIAAQDTSRPVYRSADLVPFGLHPRHLWSLIWPDLYHVADQIHHVPGWIALEALPTHVSATFNWPESVFAPGLAAVFVLPLALAVRAHRAVALLFGALLVLGFGLATARAPFLQLSELLPGAQAGDLRRFLFTFAMAATVLAAVGVERLAASRPLRIAFAIAAIAVAIASVIQALPALRLDDQAFRTWWAERLLMREEAAGLTLDQIRDAMLARPFETPDNRAAQAMCFLRTALVALLAAAAAFGLRGARLVVALAAITAGELLVTGAGTIVAVPTARVTTPPATIAPALDATRRAREATAPLPRFARLFKDGEGIEMQLLPVNLAAYHGLEDVFAYHPLPPRRLEEFFDALEPGTPIVTRGAGVRGFYRAASLASPLVDLLGVRYVLAERHALPDDGRWIDVSPSAAPERIRLWERTEPWPRATFVDRCVVVPAVHERLQLLETSDAATLRTTVVLEDAGAPAASGDGVVNATVAVTEHRDERVVVRITTDEPGYLRLADPFDPGWTATLDGERTPVFAADHRFRAVHVPSGEHELVFAYDAASVRAPQWIAAAAFLLAIALVVAGRGKPR